MNCIVCGFPKYFPIFILTQLDQWVLTRWNTYMVTEKENKAHPMGGSLFCLLVTRITSFLYLFIPLFQISFQEINSVQNSHSVQGVGKYPDAGKGWGHEEKGATVSEMVGWHHWLNGHEFEQTQGDSERQGNLACCSSWGRRESDMT